MKNLFSITLAVYLTVFIVGCNNTGRVPDYQARDEEKDCQLEVGAAPTCAANIQLFHADMKCQGY